jgi:hypothetical protein
LQEAAFYFTTTQDILGLPYTSKLTDNFQTKASVQVMIDVALHEFADRGELEDFAASVNSGLK